MITKLEILDTAVTLAETYGYTGVFKRHIAALLGCSAGVVNYHWGDMKLLRAAMIVRAKQKGRHKLILKAAENAITDAVLS